MLPAIPGFGICKTQGCDNHTSHWPFTSISACDCAYAYSVTTINIAITIQHLHKFVCINDCFCKDIDSNNKKFQLTFQ